jgi:hypothetical protein
MRMPSCDPFEGCRQRPHLSRSFVASVCAPVLQWTSTGGTTCRCDGIAARKRVERLAHVQRVDNGRSFMHAQQVYCVRKVASPVLLIVQRTGNPAACSACGCLLV